MLAKEPNDCERVEPYLHLLLDAECGPEEQTLVEENLASCSSCTERFALLRKMKGGLRELADRPAPAVSVGLQERLSAQRAQDVAVGRVAPTVAPAAQNDFAPPPSSPTDSGSSPLRAPTLLVGLLLVGGGFVGGYLFTKPPPAEAPAANVDGQAAAPAELPTEKNQAPPLPAVEDAALLARHRLDVPADIATPDTDAVQAFLQARLPNPVDLPSLEHKGLRLVGARLYLDAEQPKPQLLYRSGLGHLVSAFSRRCDPTSAPKSCVGERGQTWWLVGEP